MDLLINSILRHKMKIVWITWIIVMFLSAVWILILTAPIHCRVNYFKSALMKKQTHLHLEGEYIFNKCSCFWRAIDSGLFYMKRRVLLLFNMMNTKQVCLMARSVPKTLITTLLCLQGNIRNIKSAFFSFVIVCHCPISKARSLTVDWFHTWSDSIHSELQLSFCLSQIPQWWYSYQSCGRCYSFSPHSPSCWDLISA